ncbi:hypothetical protein LWE69_12565 [Paenibacillus sp. UKAQ_18]|nr:hypothetical protein [Paenibacillus sp. UKAQ_18]
MDDGSPLDGILDVDIPLHRIYLLGETLMTYAYTSILAAVLLFIGVVSIDRCMIITSIEPNTLSIGRVAHE